MRYKHKHDHKLCIMWWFYYSCTAASSAAVSSLKSRLHEDTSHEDVESLTMSQTNICHNMHTISQRVCALHLGTIFCWMPFYKRVISLNYYILFRKSEIFMHFNFLYFGPHLPKMKIKRKRKTKKRYFYLLNSIFTVKRSIDWCCGGIYVFFPFDFFLAVVAFAPIYIFFQSLFVLMLLHTPFFFISQHQ